MVSPVLPDSIFTLVFEVSICQLFYLCCFLKTPPASKQRLCSPTAAAKAAHPVQGPAAAVVAPFAPFSVLLFERVLPLCDGKTRMHLPGPRAGPMAPSSSCPRPLRPGGRPVMAARGTAPQEHLPTPSVGYAGLERCELAGGSQNLPESFGLGIFFFFFFSGKPSVSQPSLYPCEWRGVLPFSASPEGCPLSPAQA